MNIVKQSKRNQFPTKQVEDDLEIDVIALEDKIQIDYQSQNTPYTDFEVDAKCDFGNYIYRVWCGHCCLGCFYRSPVSDFWIAEPFYGGINRHNYKSANKAQRAVIKAYLKAKIS
jgi:hypothetical protein